MPAGTTRRAAPSKAAERAAPKLNKAQLEEQVIKLERTIARLRNQNAELKQAAREDAQNAAKATPAPVAKTSSRPKSVAEPREKRGETSTTYPAQDAPSAAIVRTTSRPSRRSSGSKTGRAARPAVEPDALPDDTVDETAAEE